MGGGMTLILNGTTGIDSPGGDVSVSQGLSGNLTFTGAGQRITWNMSPAAIADRVFFQTSVTNGASDLNIMPNGTGFASNFTAFSSSDPANSSLMRVGVSTSTGVGFLNSFKLGTGTTLPITFQVDGTERMRIDTSGNVGIGTSSVTSRLQISGAGETAAPATNGAKTATIYATANQNTGNCGGAIEFGGQSTTTFAAWKGGLIDGTANTLGYLAAYTRNSSSDVSMTERMRIDSSGNLLVGQTSWSFSNNGTQIAANGRIYNTSNTDYNLELAGSTSARIRFYTSAGGSGTTVGSITVSGSATTYATSSDYRLKENVAPMTGALATVAALKPVTYNWKADGSDGQGFIAHELQAVVPDCVTGQKDAVDAEGNPQYQGVDTSFLVATLVAAIQELKNEVDALKGAQNV
jgi:hypothetical protein